MDSHLDEVLASLKQNTVLTTLDLRDSRIGVQGAEHVAATLEQNTVLTKLDVGCNYICFQGAERVAAALKRNRVGFLVLTISCESQGPERCAITCTKMGGSQMVFADLEPQQTVEFLRDTIGAQLGHEGHLRLVRNDGTLLNDAVAISDCLL